MCGNYSREETIQGRKLYEEIRYSWKERKTRSNQNKLLKVKGLYLMYWDQTRIKRQSYSGHIIFCQIVYEETAATVHTPVRRRQRYRSKHTHHRVERMLTWHLKRGALCVCAYEPRAKDDQAFKNMREILTLCLFTYVLDIQREGLIA